MSRRKFLQAAGSAALSAAALACFGCSSSGSSGTDSAVPSAAVDDAAETGNDEQNDSVEPGQAEQDSVVEFGHWEQDGDDSNGAEPIEWMVLDEKDGHKLLISKYILAFLHYNDEGGVNTGESVTWETCTLRAWLNGEFYEGAFSEEEREAIQLTDVANPGNPDYPGTEGGNDTQDKVFLLSIDEAKAYFSDDDARKCEATQTVRDEGIDVYNGYSGWWLRSPGHDPDLAAVVDLGGCVVSYGVGVDGMEAHGVRPALWV